jgi:predicted dehydrogenase
MEPEKNIPTDTPMTRRHLLQAAAAIGAGAIASDLSPGQGTQPASSRVSEAAPDLNVAVVGCGTQGRVLLRPSLRIPGIHIKAICDIWPYSQRFGTNIVKATTNQTPNVYRDYQEMLDKEKGLDAVIVATPDWMHAPIAVACLNAGLHVYCEKEMADTVEAGRSMVQAARKAGKHLQIGHQRRSSPRYLKACEMARKDKRLGRIVNAYAQWNRPRQQLVPPPKEQHLDEDTLKKYGYDTMQRFYNWRWFRKFSAGPIADLGSHQVDVFNWFLSCAPRSVLAGGGVDYYKDREWYDNIMAVYEYRTTAGVVRAAYHVLNATATGGFYETFMGDEATMNISESWKGGIYLTESPDRAKPWENLQPKIEIGPSDEIRVVAWEVGPDLEKSPYQYHLENFFDAVRKGTPLTCPGEDAFETAVAVIKVNEAIEGGRKIEIKASEYKT